MDWGGANSRFLGLVSVWAARSFDQTALRPSVIKRIRQIDVKYITHITSFGVTAWTRVTAWTCMCELPRCTVHWTRISIHWILDFKQLLLLLLSPSKHHHFYICSFLHVNTVRRRFRLIHVVHALSYPLARISLSFTVTLCGVVCNILSHPLHRVLC